MMALMTTSCMQRGCTPQRPPRHSAHHFLSCRSGSASCMMTWLTSASRMQWGWEAAARTILLLPRRLHPGPVQRAAPPHARARAAVVHALVQRVLGCHGRAHALQQVVHPLLAHPAPHAGRCGVRPDCKQHHCACTCTEIGVGLVGKSPELNDLAVAVPLNAQQAAHG